MTGISTRTRSLRLTRAYARVPRILALTVAVILVIAGLRATLAGTPEPAPAAPTTAPRLANDIGVESFAEGFARAYLTWDASNPDRRTEQLRPYVAGLAADGGLQPADGTNQSVIWAAVVGERATADAELITLAVQTSARLVYLTVPVSRNDRGFLSIHAYPAIVGPPATDPDPEGKPEEEVEDDGLRAVVERAIRNFLDGNRTNLLADLTPDAFVSMPDAHMTVTRVDNVSWVVPTRRVAVQVDATDAQENAWTLRYELDVRKHDRWYVHSVHVNPTFQGEK